MSRHRDLDIPLSFIKLFTLVQHNIDRYKKIAEAIENDTTYYVLHEPETLKDYRDITAKLEEWEEIQDILENKVEVLIL